MNDLKRSELKDGLVKVLEREFGKTTEYACIEDMLRKLVLIDKANEEGLSEAEEKELDRLNSLTPSPKLQEALEKLGEERPQDEERQP